MSVKPRTIRLGTRSSPLAMKQTEMVRAALHAAYPDLETEIVAIKTSGDWRPEDGEVRLKAAQDGKALFTKEIEEALLRGEIDAGIHSMRDMQTFLPKGLIVTHMLPREDARDILIANDNTIKTINDLPHGARIGTCSLRRQAFLLNKRPDLKIQILRGNVQTRLDKLRASQVDATLLARAGLKRLGIKTGHPLTIEDMTPAAGQGAIGIETREKDQEIASLFDGINCYETFMCTSAERGALTALKAGCHTPVGAYASIQNNFIHLRLKLATPDGIHIFSGEEKQNIKSAGEAKHLGFSLGQKLKAQVPSDILRQIL